MSSEPLPPGKLKCKYLRDLRVKFAKEHGIDYQPAECHHKGDCQGTCPACDSELEFLNNRINLEKMSSIEASLPKLKDYEKYDVVIREMIDKEISRQDSHLKWVNTIHVALFPLLFHVADKKDILWISFMENPIPNIYIIYSLGIVCSVIYFTTYLTSEVRIKRILYFWDGYCKFTNTTYFDYPPVWGFPVTENELKKGCLAHRYFGDYHVGNFRKYASKAIIKKIYPILTGLLWFLLLCFSLLQKCG